MLALLFPGQGSQRPGMGRAWQGHPSWEVVDELSDASGRDLAHLLVDAGADVLRQTRNAQVATFALSMLILDAARRSALGEAGVAAGAGHSLGEYSALVASGALDRAQGARLVAERGEAMHEAATGRPGTMAAILGLDLPAVTRACAGVEGAWVANDNAPGQVVVAGTAAGVAQVSEAAVSSGARRVVALPVGGAFHTPLMQPAQDRLDAALARTRWAPASPPVVANVDARPHTAGWPELLGAQLCAPVRWRQSLLALADLGVDRFVELGPGRELSGMVKRTVEPSLRSAVAVPADLDGLVELVDHPAGV